MTIESVAPEHVSCAEVRAQTESLGLPVPWLAAEWGVSEGTVRNWMKGASILPQWVIADVQTMVDHTQQRLNEMVAGVQLGGVLYTYRNDREYEQAPQEDQTPYCASWHRALCARAQREVHATIEYRFPRGQV